jgi:hypothetical protein
MTRACIVFAVLLLASSIASAQGLDANLSLMGDMVPAKQVRARELRARLFAEHRQDVGDHLRLTAAGFAEALLGDRSPGLGETAAIVRPEELHVELHGRTFDVRVGISRVVWGRLDEYLPTDVVNPLDLAKFFLEGRAEARLAVPMVRARWLPSERLTVEGVYVPFFTRGRFDQLAESTSPFNPTGAIGRVSYAPPRTWSSVQGGVRTSVTTGRVDWSISAYRGFEPFPVFQLASADVFAPFAPPMLEERFPRFTMVGGDFETVRGEWGVRGEVAAFVDRAIVRGESFGVAPGSAIEGGLGADRRAGDYRVSGSVLVTHRRATLLDLRDTDALLVTAVERSFARETRRVRGFVAYNPAEGSAFARVIGVLSVSDRAALEGSIGLFSGNGSDALGRLSNRDFAYARLRVFF